MAILWKGAPVATAINERTAAEVAELAANGVQPSLAIVRVGERDDDLAYERMAIRRAEAVGIRIVRHVAPPDTSTDEMRKLMACLNADASVHGILLLRPLPPQIDEACICNAIAPQKDVDGVTSSSLASVFTGAGDGFAPCTAAACMALLSHYGVDPAGRRAVVVGRSLVVGRPLAMLLLQANATVTICHTRTRDLEGICRQADIVVAAAGKPRMIGAKHLSAGQVVLDVGIHDCGDGTLCGDVMVAEAEPLVSALTPVPGGVGSVTTAVLLQHVAQATRRQAIV